MKTKSLSFWQLPVIDYLRVLQKLSKNFKLSNLLLLVLCVLVSWLIYVPIHELLHAAGCILSGGSVQRLELDAIYGAAWLKQWLPWISVGSEYAGQLVEFDTNNSDICYLITVLLPYLLTIFPGAVMLEHALRINWEKSTPWIMLGLSSAMIIAPFVSLIGDMYESGSIIVTRVVMMFNPSADVDRWRSDDFALLIKLLWSEITFLDGFIIFVAFTLSILQAWLIYYLGKQLAERILHAR